MRACQQLVQIIAHRGVKVAVQAGALLGALRVIRRVVLALQPGQPGLRVAVGRIHIRGVHPPDGENVAEAIERAHGAPQVAVIAVAGPPVLQQAIMHPARLQVGGEEGSIALAGNEGHGAGIEQQRITL